MSGPLIVCGLPVSGETQIAAEGGLERKLSTTSSAMSIVRQLTERCQRRQDAATHMESSWALNSLFKIRC
jgi:hypothetical protein